MVAGPHLSCRVDRRSATQGRDHRVTRPNSPGEDDRSASSVDGPAEGIQRVVSTHRDAFRAPTQSNCAAAGGTSGADALPSEGARSIRGYTPEGTRREGRATPCISLLGAESVVVCRTGPVQVKRVDRVACDVVVVVGGAAFYGIGDAIAVMAVGRQLLPRVERRTGAGSDDDGNQNDEN